MHALHAATLCEVPRLPFWLDGVVVGSVAVAHLPLLARHAALLEPLRHHTLPEQRDHDTLLEQRDHGTLLEQRGDGLHWRLPGADSEAVFDALHRALRAEGHIRAWRDEPFAIVDPSTQRVLARIERAASRFWGTLTFGAHATGYVADARGRPQALWIAQRAFDKATDPGLYDNLIGGGVPFGQSPEEALVREAFEEAGLQPQQVAGARPAGVLRLQRDIAEGFQHEWLYSYDIALPDGVLPQNQDGEVAGFTLMAPEQALALAAGDTMTVDAALVTLDFGLRHGLLAAAERAAVADRIASLRVVRLR